MSSQQSNSCEVGVKRRDNFCHLIPSLAYTSITSPQPALISAACCVPRHEHIVQLVSRLFWNMCSIKSLTSVTQDELRWSAERAGAVISPVTNQEEQQKSNHLSNRRYHAITRFVFSKCAQNGWNWLADLANYSSNLALHPNPLRIFS